jgi:hypothetical protein
MFFVVEKTDKKASTKIERRGLIAECTGWQE